MDFFCGQPRPGHPRERWSSHSLGRSKLRPVNPTAPLDLGRKGPDDLEFGRSNSGAPNQVFDRARPRLALVTPAGQVQVWDWALGQRVREWPANADQGQASVSRFSADGQTLVLSTFHPTTRAYHYREWAIATGQETRAIALPPPKPGSRRFLAHAPGANELLLISTEDTASMRYEFAAARFIPTTLLHLKQTSGRPSFSVDGRYLFAASVVGEVRVFDATTLQETAKLRGFMFGAHSVGFSPEGHRLVTGSTAQESITIWDRGNYERLLTFPTTDSGFGSTGFSPDGNVLVGRSTSATSFSGAPPPSRKSRRRRRAPPSSRASRHNNLIYCHTHGLFIVFERILGTTRYDTTRHAMELAASKVTDAMNSAETYPVERGLGQPGAGQPPARFDEGESSPTGNRLLFSTWWGSRATAGLQTRKVSPARFARCSPN